MVEQGDNVVENDAIDFHLIEFISLAGTSTMGAPKWSMATPPVSISFQAAFGYYQPESEVYQETIGPRGFTKFTLMTAYFAKRHKAS